MKRSDFDVQNMRQIWMELMVNKTVFVADTFYTSIYTVLSLLFR